MDSMRNDEPAFTGHDDESLPSDAALQLREAGGVTAGTPGGEPRQQIPEVGVHQQADEEPAAPKLLLSVSELAMAARLRKVPLWGDVRRGQVSLFLGQPGVGKSQFILQAATAMATGRPFAGNTPTGSYQVVLCSVEDTFEVISDRLTAIAEKLGADRQLLEQNLRIVNFEGTLVLFEATAKGVRPTDAGRKLFAEARAFRADVVCLDPMAQLHILAESDNSSMNPLMSAISSFARSAEAAVMMTHHVNKPDGDKRPTLHSCRGAGAIVAAARYVEIFSELDKKEKEEFDISDEAAPDYIRRDIVKSSYSRRSGKPTYFKRESIDVGGITAPVLDMAKLVKKKSI